MPLFFKNEDSPFTRRRDTEEGHIENLGAAFLSQVQ